MLDSILKLADKFIEVTHAVGVPQAVGICAGGAVLYWLGKDALPAVWTWFTPHATELLDLYKLKLRRDLGLESELHQAFPAKDEPPKSY